MALLMSFPKSKFRSVTYATAEIILGPPEAPTTNLTLFCLSMTIEGDMEDAGRFPGLM